MFRSHKKFAIILDCIVFLAFALNTEGFPLRTSGKEKKSNSTDLYRRYVRVRGPVYADDNYVEEILEVFYINKKPPQFLFADRDIDLIIRCDFEPHLKECDELKKDKEIATPPILPPLPPNASKTLLRAPLRPSYKPSSTPVTTTKRTTTTTTTIPTTTRTTTEADLPLLPDIPDSEEDNGNEFNSENKDDYEERIEEQEDSEYKEENEYNEYNENNVNDNDTLYTKDIVDPEDGDDF